MGAEDGSYRLFAAYQTGTPSLSINSSQTPALLDDDNINLNSSDVLIQITSIFDILDLDENGDLDLDEFEKGLKSIGANLSNDEAIIIFDSIDADS